MLKTGNHGFNSPLFGWLIKLKDAATSYKYNESLSVT